MNEDRDDRELHAEKLFNSVFFDRFDALHRDTQLMAVYEHFGREVFRRSSVLEGLDSFIRDTGFGGKRCVEIGTCHGLTAVVLARYFDEVVTIDIAPSPHKQRVADFLGVTNIRFIDVKSNAEKAEVIRGLAAFDGAYCDGDHARDTETDFALLSASGQVLFHEHWAPQPPVVRLVQQLSRDGHQVVTAGKWALWRP
jgi:predicted O-methyltransferase YrrM